jgi:hypothetical protein
VASVRPMRIRVNTASARLPAQFVLVMRTTTRMVFSAFPA